MRGFRRERDRATRRRTHVARDLGHFPKSRFRSRLGRTHMRQAALHKAMGSLESVSVVERALGVHVTGKVRGKREEADAFNKRSEYCPYFSKNTRRPDT